MKTPIIPVDNDTSLIANAVRSAFRSEAWARAFIKPATETIVSLPPPSVITAHVPDLGTSFSLDKSRAVVREVDDDDKYAKKGGGGGGAAWTPTNFGPKKVRGEGAYCGRLRCTCLCF